MVIKNKFYLEEKIINKSILIVLFLFMVIQLPVIYSSDDYVLGLSNNSSVQKMGLNDVGNTINNNQDLNQEHNGYIIIFNELSISEKYIELNKPINERLSKIENLNANPTKENLSEINKLNEEIVYYDSILENEIKSYPTYLSNKSKEYNIILKENITNFDNLNKNEYNKLIFGTFALISDKQAEDIRKLDFVKDVVPNGVVKIVLDESIPLIGANTVWNELGFDGDGITIAIVDTGVDYTHPDLGSCFGVGCKVIDGYDFVNNDSDPIDDQGHGTHCAGIAAGNGTSNETLKGVAPNATIYAYKVLDFQGYGNTSNIISALESAVDPNNDLNFDDHVDVISMSLGGSIYYNAPLVEVVNNISTIGPIVVVAAGNNGRYGYNSVLSPGIAEKAITVGASDYLNNVAPFSSKGPLSDGHIKPDVVAPGVNICSTQLSNFGFQSQCLDNLHVSLSGTSMATPHVAGLAALIKQAHPDWNSKDIKYAIRNNADDINADIFSKGFGRVNAYKSVTDVKPVIINLDKDEQTSTIVSFSANVSNLNVSHLYKYEFNIGFYDYEYNSKSTIDWNKYSSINYSSGISSLYITIYNIELNNFIDSGIYVAQLKFTDLNTGKVAYDSVSFNIDSVVILYPVSNSIYGNRKIMNIGGSINLPSLNYSISYRLSGSDDNWSSYGVVKYDGLLNLIDEKLGYITEGILNSGSKYDIKLSSYIWGNEYIDVIRNIYIDGTLDYGFPIYIASAYDTQMIFDQTYLFPRTPVFYDLDNDSNKEIIIGGSDKLIVLKNDGSLLFEPVTVNELSTSFYFEYVFGVPSIGDIDSDGEPEILVARYFNKENNLFDFLYAYNADGSLVDGYPLYINNIPEFPNSNDSMLYLYPLILEDIDNDNRLDICLETADQNNNLFIVILDGNGAFKNKIQILENTTGHNIGLAIGDIDSDNNVEFVTTGFDSIRNIAYTIILSNTGEVKRVTPYSQGANYSGYSFLAKAIPKLINLDNDSDLEIIIFGVDTLRIENPDGAPFEGWEEPFYLPEYNVMISETSQEIGVIRTEEGFNLLFSKFVNFGTDINPKIGYVLYLVNQDKEILWVKEFKDENYRYINSPPVLVDITGDGISEIFINLSIGTYDYMNKENIFVFDLNGDLISNLTRKTIYPIISGIAVEDIDNDSKIEVATVDNYPIIYLWEFDATSSFDEYIDLQGNVRHTGVLDSIKDIFTHIPVPSKYSGIYYPDINVSLFVPSPYKYHNIYYTLDGSTPTISSNLYVGQISIDKNTNLKAIATRPGYLPSQILSLNYTILDKNFQRIAPTPIASKKGGKYPSPFKLKLSLPINTGNEEFKIYYTLDGSAPDRNTGKLYIDPLYIKEYTVLKAISVLEGYQDSNVLKEEYIIIEKEKINIETISPDITFDLDKDIIR